MDAHGGRHVPGIPVMKERAPCGFVRPLPAALLAPLLPLPTEWVHMVRSGDTVGQVSVACGGGGGCSAVPADRSPDALPPTMSPRPQSCLFDNSPHHPPSHPPLSPPPSPALQSPPSCAALCSPHPPALPPAPPPPKGRIRIGIFEGGPPPLAGPAPPSLPPPRSKSCENRFLQRLRHHCIVCFVDHFGFWRLKLWGFIWQSGESPPPPLFYGAVSQLSTTGGWGVGRGSHTTHPLDPTPNPPRS